jgi:hypothetical protein
MLWEHVYICSSWYYKYDWRTVQLHAHRDTIERTNTSTKKPSRDERGQFGRPRALASPLFPHTRGSVRALLGTRVLPTSKHFTYCHAASPKSTGPPHHIRTQLRSRRVWMLKWSHGGFAMVRQ